MTGIDPETLLERFRTRVEHPATLKELFDLFSVPKAQRAGFRRALRRLVAQGAVVETRGRHYGLPERMQLARGRLNVHPHGYAFVELTDAPSGTGDVYVAPQHLGEAMHGDAVIVRIDRQRPDGRADGRVIRVLERRTGVLVGRFEEDRSGLRYVVPFDRRLLSDIQLTREGTAAAKPGEMVVVELTRWPTPSRGPAGRVVEVLGAPDDPGVDLRLIVHKHALADEHPEPALREAKRLGGSVRERDLAGRRDFRQLDIVTIDGEHARDFDDAISLERLENGHYWLGVHIADVSHYVETDTALDREARARATSVYFPERALHMFPSDLATGLCSLNPGVDRLVQSVLMEVDGSGRVRRAEFADGVICSRARMTYTAVNALLADAASAEAEAHRELMPLFERMAALYEILRRRRTARGSIDFDLPESEVVLDADGLVEQILVAERNIAHRLIEEFMLLANETVAEYLDQHGVGTLFRVHERPDPAKVAEFEAFIAPLGHGLGREADEVQPRDFQRLVDRIRDRPEERPIALLMLRTMQKARYDPANLGHYGLATPHYLHFTSPIRRYPDLVVHRTLRRLRHEGAGSATLAELADELPELARHCSDMERRADEAERELLQWKKVRFMAGKIGDEYDGFIVGVAAFGLFVELIDHFVEGLVHISTMADDYYRFLDRTHSLRGEATGRIYRLGDRVSVQVLRADMERRQIDFGLVDVLERLRESAPARRRPKARRALGRGRPGRRERQVRRGRR
jgi:ribonuclease R